MKEKPEKADGISMEQVATIRSLFHRFRRCKASIARIVGVSASAVEHHVKAPYTDEEKSHYPHILAPSKCSCGKCGSVDVAPALASGNPRCPKCNVVLLAALNFEKNKLKEIGPERSVANGLH